MVKRLILMIDDEKEFCQITKMNLELMSGFTVITAFSGKEGIKIARQHNPDLILCDINMPHMDGLQVLEALKKDAKTMAIPVVMLTARQDEYAKRKAAQLYDEEYITKPIGIQDLKEEIKKILRRKKGL
ncbi:MAG: response regulator [Candidatus Omnitrophica bacterium]|nr:response regulator [Candidatus Omnitrophota bacterium]